MAASPEHVQPCVECGGWGEGWIMSQAHMLASVPDLLVSPVRHVTQHGAACAPGCCVCVCDETMQTMQNTPHADVR